MSFTLNDRLSVISNYPLFSNLLPDELNKLAKLFKEESVPPNTLIVNEGDPVDAIYLIVSGAAEVSRKVNQIEKKIYNVATLAKGDAIGLTPEGFFSQTGLRMGTVISALPTTLLVITLEELYHFLTKSSQASSPLKEACENILFVNFVKKSYLFGHLDMAQVQLLIKAKEKISLTKGAILFKENDPATKFYFIISGQLIISTNEKELASLGPSQVVGEGAFISGEKRNATATALTDAELFALDAKHIQAIDSQLLRTKIEERRIKQLRPLPRKSTVLREEQTPEKETVTILYNPNNQAKLILSKADYLIWKNLDGKTSLGDILDNNSVEFRDKNIFSIYSRVLKMANAGLVDLKKKTFLDTLIERIQLAW